MAEGAFGLVSGSEVGVPWVGVAGLPLDLPALISRLERFAAMFAVALDMSKGPLFWTSRLL